MEFTPEPIEGRIFSSEHPNLLADCDPLGRLRLDGLARILADAATLDNESSPTPDKGLWILRRLSLNLETWPRYLDLLKVRTWCSGIGRAWAERRSDLHHRDQHVGRAKALWVNVMPETGFPRSLPRGFLEVFGPSAAGRTIKPRFELAVPSGKSTASGVLSLRYADLDIVDHVNNAVHLALVEELLAPTKRGTASQAVPYRSITIEFHDALQTPDPVDYRCWRDDTAITICFSQASQTSSVVRLAEINSTGHTGAHG
ncbi:MAG: thioesterase [Ferrimicrobium sp.]|nr:thioesterase [Ferrimicrobium sp.]